MCETTAAWSKDQCEQNEAMRIKYLTAVNEVLTKINEGKTKVENGHNKVTRTLKDVTL